MLDQGYLPEPASIRVEEWVNAIDRTDPPPAGGADVGVNVETHESPRAGDGTQLVRIGLSTRPLADEERPPANLTFVVDTSGSMDIRDRLGLVKASLALLAQQLRDDDTISIVTYGDEASPLLAPTPVRDVERIVAAIDELVPGGSTNLESGLQLGYEQARASSGTGPSTWSCSPRTASPTSASPTPPCSPTRSPRPARRASTSSPSASAWATTTTS